MTGQGVLDFRASDPATSRDAARSAKQRAAGIRADILGVFAQRGPQSDFELCEALPFHVPGSVIKRRGELEKDGVIEDSGRRQVNRNHRRVIVWQLVDGAR